MEQNILNLSIVPTQWVKIVICGRYEHLCSICCVGTHFCYAPSCVPGVVSL